MGGPDSLDAVEPYLRNIFNDPDIIDIPFPGFIRNRFVKWLAGKRTPESREIYEKIGGKTPLTGITVRQAVLLEQMLNSKSDESYKVYPAMRYWHPLVEDIWREIKKQNYDRIVVLSLYPFYSTATGGSLVNLINRLSKGEKIRMIDRFGSNATFIEAMKNQILNTAIEYALTEDEEINVLCSTHSIPVKRILKGDPYKDEVEEAFTLLQNSLPKNFKLWLSYQSKIGPVKWLEPSTPQMIEQLAGKGIKKLIAYPFGFVADNSETLYEIGMLYRDLALEKGINEFYSVSALNEDELFIQVLKDEILKVNQDRNTGN